MVRYGFTEKNGAAAMAQVIIFIFVAALTIMVQPAYSEDEAIEVTCFKGEVEEANNLGNITVTDPETAGEDCNSTFYDCEGKCVGGYYDKDVDKNICYTKSGKIVSK